jgi:O-antigen ligase
MMTKTSDISNSVLLRNAFAALACLLVCAVLLFSFVNYDGLSNFNLADSAIKLVFLLAIIGGYFFVYDHISPFEKQIIRLFLVYAIGLIAIAASHEYKILFSFRIEMYWHALLLLSLFMLYRQIALTARFYWIFLGFMALTVFGIAFYSVLDGHERAGGVAENINAYGKLAGLVFIFFSIKLVAYRYEQPSKKLVDLGLMLMAGFGLYISETRAAWVGVALTLLIVSPFLFKSLTYKKFILLLTALFAGGALVAFTNTEAVQRMANGWSDIEQFFAGNIHTSWGYRLEMWRIVLLGFVDYPLFGQGLDSFNAYTIALTQSGVTQLPNGFGSPHNEYLHMLFSLGLVGLLLFVVLLIGLLVLLFIAVGGVNNISRSLYAVLYFALVIYIAITCLFDTSWSNKHLIYVYVIMLTASAFMLQKDLKVKDN